MVARHSPWVNTPGPETWGQKPGARDLGQAICIGAARLITYGAMKPCLPVIALLSLASPAWADAIDGHWCDDGTKHLEINGPAIVTPSGAKLTGDYDRHGFRYAEPGNGTSIVMILMGETRMMLKADDGPEEMWHRCAAPTS